jgi:CRP/FNR family cyclic AMP-dependent transcriptional regulator
MWRTRNDERLGQLADMRLFAGCSRNELARVASNTTPVIVQAGRVLATEGSRARELIIVVDGTATATVSGEEVVTLGPGSTFGAAALLDGGPHMATLTARSTMLTMVVTEWELQSLLSDCPSAARRLMTELAGRLRAATESATLVGGMVDEPRARLAS